MLTYKLLREDTVCSVLQIFFLTTEFFFGREIYFGKLHSVFLISTRDSDYLLVYISTNKCIYRSKFLLRQMSLCKN